MVAGRVKQAFYVLALFFGGLIWLSLLMLFSQVAQDTEEFSRLQAWILPINVIAIVVLLVLIVGNLVRLIRDRRRHVPGARLKARMVTLLTVLAGLYFGYPLWALAAVRRLR